jgi:hypothetical protein
MSESIGLFSNFWWATVASDYSVSMLLGITFVAMILKIIAILKPGVKTDAIMELISGWIFTVPGARTTVQKEAVNARKREKRKELKKETKKK